MSYSKFCKQMQGISKNTGISVRTKIREDGKYEARFASGILITGNSDSNAITVKWGDGHQAMKRIA